MLLLYSALVLATIAIADAQPSMGTLNTAPINGLGDSVCLGNPRAFVADSNSLCWFYQCIPARSGEYTLLAKRCALGTYVSPNFVFSLTNPCTQRYPILGMYDCTRRPSDPAPDCKSQLSCKNGGTPMQEDNLCWCSCPIEWQGAADCRYATDESCIQFCGLGKPSPCSKAKGPVGPAGSACTTAVDWCGNATQANGGVSPCKNGGTCINQCVGFYCACPLLFTKTRYCEF